MLEQCTPKASSMVAVSLEPVKVQAILDSKTQGLSNCCISCYSSPRDCVVSGPILELERLKQYLAEKAHRCTQLDVPYGYHSPAMFPVIDDLTTIARKVNVHTPTLPVISTALGRVILPGDLSFRDEEYFARHCTQPVRLVDAMESYLSDPGLSGGETTYLEIGHHPTVFPMLKSFPRISDCLILSSLHKRLDCWTSLNKALASLYLIQTINWTEVFAHLGPTACISIPSYPFSKRKFWVPYQEPSSCPASSRKVTFSFLRNWCRYPSITKGAKAVLEASLEDLRLYIEGHRVGGIPLCPASVYLELAVSSISLTLTHLTELTRGFSIALRCIKFSQPLAGSFSDDRSTLRTVVSSTDKSFTIETNLGSSQSEVVHAEGEYQLLRNQEIRNEFDDLLPSVTRHAQNVLNPGDGRIPETFSMRTAYQIIFPRVVEYSKAYHTMQSITMSSDGMEAAARIRMDHGSESRTFVTHPLFLDVLIHVIGFVCNLHGGQTHAYICNEIAAFNILPSTVDMDASYTIYCRILEVHGQECLVGESYAVLNAQTPILIAHLKGVRFERVRLTGLKLRLAKLAGLSNYSSHRKSEAEYDQLESSTSIIESVVIDLIAKACGIDKKSISIRDRLDAYGIDSLMRIELCYDISKAFPGFGYRLDDISLCPNLQNIVDLISSGLSSPNLDPSVTSTPLMLVACESPVKRVFSQVLNVEEESIKEDVELASLGLDSLSTIEVSHILSTQYQIDIPLNAFSPRGTIRDIEQQLFPNGSSPLASPSISTQDGELWRSLVKLKDGLGLGQRIWTLQSSNMQRTPLFLIHDGSGLAASYRHILDLDRPVFGINNPNFISSRLWVTITQMAESYAKFILEKGNGNILLGGVFVGLFPLISTHESIGWSFGGIVAFEVAKILHAQSVLVKGVILIDVPDPVNHVPLSDAIIEQVSNNLDPALQELCKRQFVMNAQLLSKYDPNETKDYGNPPGLALLRSKENYNPHNVKDLPSWLSDRQNAESMTHGWERFAGPPLNVFDIPGNHFEPFEPQNVGHAACSIFVHSQIP